MPSRRRDTAGHREELAGVRVLRAFATSGAGALSVEVGSPAFASRPRVESLSLYAGPSPLPRGMSRGPLRETSDQGTKHVQKVDDPLELVLDADRKCTASTCRQWGRSASSRGRFGALAIEQFRRDSREACASARFQCRLLDSTHYGTP